MMANGSHYLFHSVRRGQMIISSLTSFCLTDENSFVLYSPRHSTQARIGISMEYLLAGHFFVRQGRVTDVAARCTLTPDGAPSAVNKIPDSPTKLGIGHRCPVGLCASRHSSFRFTLFHLYCFLVNISNSLSIIYFGQNCPCFYCASPLRLLLLLLPIYCSTPPPIPNIIHHHHFPLNNSIFAPLQYFLRRHFHCHLHH